MAQVLLAAFLSLISCGFQALGQETAPAPTELSENSVQALLIRKVAPVYPPLARQARIQGTVVLRIVINKAGEVRDVQLVSGHPMLAPAAIEAVKQWMYQPYMKDGEAIDVSSNVQVSFKMPDEPTSGGTIAAQGGVITGVVASSTGGGIRASEAEMRAQRIQQTDPIYPPMAIRQKVQGTVVLDAQISATGAVENLMLISGHPMLTAAAIEAVKQWRYRPYVINGNPVAVTSMVRLQFILTDNDTAGVVREPTPLQAMKPNEASPGTRLPLRVRVSAGVSQGLLVSKVNPVYPEEARREHVQGIVVLQATIDREGNVTDLDLINGDPLLAPAAIEAVKQWKYRPYLLNGEAVEVHTQVQVNFVLAQ